MEVTRAFKYRVDPAPSQLPVLCSNLGGARFAYNHLLGLVKANWEQIRVEKETSAGQVTDYLRTDRISLMYLWHATKDEVARDWRKNNSSEVYNDAAGRLATAFSSFRNGTGKFPVFKRKEWSGSAKFAKGSVKILDRHHVNLSRVGSLKTYESMRKMCRHLERGTGSLVSATLKRETGGWFIVFTVKLVVPDPPVRDGGRIVGVDVGLKTLLVGATPEGELVLEQENRRPYVKAQAKLARAQRIASRRQGPSGGQPGSKRYERAQARVRKIHARVSNQRMALAHEVSSHLVKHYDTIVVEDLAVKNLVKNPYLAKAIHDAGWGMFTAMLEYKANWAGVQVVKAERFYPSSKTCSACGHVKAKLSLNEREYECSECGMVLDRDLNAAINIARLGVTGPAGTHSVTGVQATVRPKLEAQRRLGPVKRQPCSTTKGSKDVHWNRSAASGTTCATNLTSMPMGVHHLPDLVLDHVQAFDYPVHVSDETSGLLGSAGALSALSSWIGSRPVLLRNADAYLSASLNGLVDGWDGLRPRLLVRSRPYPSDFGFFEYVGACLLPAGVADSLVLGFGGLYDAVWAPAYASGQLELVEAEGEFVDCGKPADYLRANLHASVGVSVLGAGAVAGWVCG